MNYSICTHWKRALCFVLAFAMLLTLLPVGTLAEGSETVPAADAETTPAPTTAEFTVKFLDWDGTLLCPAQTVPRGDAAIEPDMPTREGYRFIGWDRDFDNVQSNLVVTAQYEKLDICTLRVIYRYVNGTSAAAPAVSSYRKGHSVDLTIESPVISGYTADKAQVHFSFDAIDGDHTETVTYTPAAVTYTVEYRRETLADGVYETDADATQTKTGLYGEKRTVEPEQSYEGFTKPKAQHVTLGSDTVVRFDYARKSYRLSFDSNGGDPVDSVYVKYGTALADLSLPTPVRSGYVFAGWENAPDAITGSVTLTAAWTPANTAFTLVYWYETVDSADKYLFEKSVAADALTGSTITLSDAQKSTAHLGSKARFFSFKKADTNVVAAGDGSSVVNVYFSRNSYTVKFLVRSDYGWSSEETELGSLTAKFEQDVEQLWPTAENWTLDGDRPNGFYGWKVDGIANDIVSKRMTMTEDLCADNADKTKNAVALTNAHYTADLNYMFESLDQSSPENGDTRKLYNGVYYDRSAVYSQQNVGADAPHFSPKLISGMTNAAVVYSCGKKDHPRGSSHCDNYLYYDRLSYTLTFKNGTAQVGAAQQRKFGASLAGTAPETPAAPPAGKTGYVFTGWYTVSDENAWTDDTRVDLETATMPAQNLELYAGWQAPMHTVTFDATGGAPTPEAQTVPHKGQIDESRVQTPVREGYDFTGWYTESGMHYVLSNAVMRDLTLIAGWKEAELTGYSVRYLDENGKTLLPTETEDGQTTGETVTVTAKPYQDNNGVLWLPETSSATRTLSGNRAENVITFVYRPASEVLLTVRYETKPGETPAFSDSETERIPNTRVPENGLLTADFNDYPGYWPDAYQKSVRPVFDKEKNAFVAEIVFLYTANEKHPYTIKHFLEQPDGSYEEQTDDCETEEAPLAARVSGTPNQYANYTYRQEKSRSSITVTGSEALDVIALYYDLGRHTVTYRIRTGDEDKGSLSGTTDYAGIRHGTLFENANAAAPAVQPGRGYKATDWSPAIPAGTTAIERDHVFEIGFERDDAQYHRVIYVANGGVGDDLVDDNNGAGYLAGAETTVWENLFTAPQGKKFTGWDTKPDGSGDAYKETDALVMPDADVTLYAQWKPLDSYTVIYLKNAEDATGTTAQQSFSEGDGVDLRENGFTRRGYRFTGWNTAADGSGTRYAPAQPYDTQTDLSLYAQWEKDPEAWHRVLYVANTPEGAVVSGTAPVDGGAYRKDDPVAAAARGNLSAVHYVFTGWNTEADGSGTAYAENAAFGFPYADRDLTLYGMWQRVTFTVTYMLDKGDENGYTEYRKDTVNEGDDYTVAADAVLEGFVFSGWKLDRTDGAVTEELTNVTEDHILYGDFTAAERKLTIRYRLTDAASKTWMTLGQPMTVAPGTRLDALLAAAESTVLNDNPGYTKLRGWNGDEAFTMAAEIMPDADFTVYAEFERITAGYTIHHVELGSGRTLADDTTGSALFGATVVTATAKKAIDGYVYHSDTGNILIAAEPEKNVATIYYTTAAAQTGELTIQKTVTGEKGDKTKAFTFTVTFDTMVVYGNQESTSFTFRLKHGERVTIPNIPDGTHYTVKESDNVGYRVSTSGAQGTIRAGESVTAAFLNSRGPVPLTGDSGAKTLGAILMGGSLLAIIVLVFIVRRRRKRS